MRLRNFKLYLSGTMISNIGMQMQSAAIGWEIYDRTRSPMALAYVGLAQVLPVFLLVLPAGQVADRVNRRGIIMVASLVIGLCSVGLAAVSVTRSDVRWMYLLLAVVGAARAFSQPAKSSFLPLIVPREQFSNAVTWTSGGFELAWILGPSAAGLVIAYLGSPACVYLLDAAACVAYFLMLLPIVPRPFTPAREAITWRSLAAGFGFLRRSPVVFAAITLDMFAVLLGGAVTLLPVYAADILYVGPKEFGWMRAAPAVGALTMALVNAHRPPFEKAGRTLLWAVAGFGLATIAFGLSRSLWLSLLMLALTGALDNISVVIRHSLVQLLTPDSMRGRVSAINSMFIGASNELGGFESGLVAAWFGPVFSVVSGGIGTLVVVLIVAVLCPSLRRYGRLGEPPRAEGPGEAVVAKPVA